MTKYNISLLLVESHVEPSGEVDTETQRVIIYQIFHLKPCEVEGELFRFEIVSTLLTKFGMPVATIGVNVIVGVK